MVYIRYSARHPTKQGTAKQYLEKVGPSEQVKGRDKTIVRARSLLKQRRGEIERARLINQVWLSDKDREQLEQQQQAAKTEERDRLLFEVAAETFIDEVGHEYADPGEVRTIFRNRLARAFSGRHLDEITRQDIRRYHADRMGRVGWFEG